MLIHYSKKGQAMPAESIRINKDAFEPIEGTEIRWLGGAGSMINCRGTVILIDPVLEGFDMPLLFESPLTPEQVPHADGVLITHIDNDHFSIPTCQKLSKVCEFFHTTDHVASVMETNGIPGQGHSIGDTFEVGPVTVELSPAKHNWQNEMPEMQYREWKEEEYCGFYLETPDGNIWMPGDLRLMEQHLHMKTPDVMLFDFSDNEWHIGFENAVTLANCYPDAKIICIHWGTVDAPDFAPFNADPSKLAERVVNPERVFALAQGECYRM